MSNNNQLVAQKPADLMAYMEKAKSQLTMALPKHIGVDRIMRLACTAWSQSADLQKCSLPSIFGATLTACQLGLEVGVGGQGYLIPYKGKATFVPGWQGIVDLVSRAGRAVVWTGAVYSGDFFDWQLGDLPFVKHKPDSDSDHFNDLEFVYAIGRINGTQTPVIEVWSKDRIIRHLNKYNKVGASHYALKDSYKHFEMYARKIPLLQVMKYMPKSIEIQKAIDVAHAAESGKPFTIDGDFVVIHNDEDDADQNSGSQQGDQSGAGASSQSQAAQSVRSRSANTDTGKVASNGAGSSNSSESGGGNGWVTPGGPGDKTLTEAEFDYLKNKLEDAALGSADMLKKFGVKLDGVTSVNYRTVLAWIKNPI